MQFKRAREDLRERWKGQRCQVILIDDARCLGKDAGYPGIGELKDYVVSMRPNSTIILKDDSIRNPPEK